MDWAQVLTIVLPVMFAIVIGIIYNNRRIDDLRLDMNERFKEVNQRFAEVHQRLVELKDETREIRNLLVA